MGKDVNNTDPDCGPPDSLRFEERHYRQLEAVARAITRGSLYEEVLSELSVFVITSPDWPTLLKDWTQLWNKGRSVVSAHVRKQNRPVRWDKVTPHQFPPAIVEDGEVIAVDHRSDKVTTIEELWGDFKWLEALLRSELTPTEKRVLDASLRFFAWGNTPSAANVAAAVREKWPEEDLSEDAVRQHLMHIRQKAQTVQGDVRRKYWRELICCPTVESAERYVDSLGPKSRCPFRLAGTAGVLGSSLGKRPLPAITPREAGYAYECAVRAWKLTRDTDTQDKHKLHAHCFANAMMGYCEILMAYSDLTEWKKATEACKAETQRTAKKRPALGFEHASLLARAARDLYRDDVADELLQFSRTFVENPDGLTAAIDRFYPSWDIKPVSKSSWLLDGASGRVLGEPGIGMPEK